jgi:hypothetical protein
MLTGQFETHLTIRVSSADLAQVGAELGLKFADIALDRGEAAATWSRELAVRGLEVVRTKIEAAPWSAGIPQTDEDAQGEPIGRYFEHHVKLLLREEPAGLAAMVAPHQAHLSRNARRIRVDGLRERFVTQRCHDVGQTTARARLSALRETLDAQRLRVVEVEEEYVVFDSNLSIDAGWIGAFE